MTRTQKLELVSSLAFALFVSWGIYKTWSERNDSVFQADSITWTDSKDVQMEWRDQRKGKEHVVDFSIGHRTAEFNRTLELSVDNRLVYWNTQGGKEFVASGWTPERAGNCGLEVLRVTMGLKHSAAKSFALLQEKQSPDLIFSPQTIYDYAAMDVCY